MFPLIGGLLSGGASLLGSIFSSQTSAQNTEANIANQQLLSTTGNQFNAEQAQLGREFANQQGQVSRDFNQREADKNRQWQEQMSATAYQRAMSDMRSAGLNPILAYQQGGASTPGGSTASSGIASSGNASAVNPGLVQSTRTSPWAGLGEAASKIVNSAISVKTFDKMTEEIANLKSTRAKTEAETATEEERPALVEAQRKKTGQETATEEKRTFTQEQENAKRALEMAGYRVTAKEMTAIDNMDDSTFNLLVKAAFAGRRANEAIKPLGELIQDVTSAKRAFQKPPVETIERHRQDTSGGGWSEWYQKRVGQ